VFPIGFGLMATKNSSANRHKKKKEGIWEKGLAM
jgi:hypothetical protein